MSLLGQVEATPKQIGQIIVIAGAEGLGKSTLLDGTPNRLFVPTEIGGGRVNSTPLLTQWEQIMSLCDEIIASAQLGQFKYKTIAWDSITAMERLLFDYCIRSDPTYGKNAKLTMETAHGAYGKAYAYARDRFAEFLAKCDMMARFGGINHVFACHVFVGRIIDTEAGEYDTTDLLLYSPKNSKTYGQRELLRQRADLIGILHERVVVSKGDKAVLATSMNGGRVLEIDNSPAFLAKNRYGLTQPIGIPKEGGWNYLADAIYKATNPQIDIYTR